MILGSSTKHKKTSLRGKTKFTSHQKRLMFSPGKVEQPGRRYQRKGKPREGLRVEA